MSDKEAIIIGAGPAGLTAAYELLDKTDIKPIIYETSDKIGGISKTIEFKGNRIDIGGHRFFSKNKEIMDWWFNILPLQGKPAVDEKILHRNMDYPKEYSQRNLKSKEYQNFPSPDPDIQDKVMLTRDRLSRIFFLAKFFDYPVTLNMNTLKNLGFLRIMHIGFSYLKSMIIPIKEEITLEDFFINRFGCELYKTFFKDYTEKVWGIPCNEIGADWGHQRIKGLSMKETILNAIKNSSKNKKNNMENVETSLISKFYYPKYGPGQMWEEVANIIVEHGGEIHYNKKIVGIKTRNSTISEIEVNNESTGEKIHKKADYFFSTMPVKDLIKSWEDDIPDNVKKTAENLQYRDFITVGLLSNKLILSNYTKKTSINNIVPDNWIYIQEREVKLGRLQIFNNWSPYMVKDPEKIWIGLEYFANEGDELWSMNDNDFIDFAINELKSINVIDKKEVLDSVLIREKKAYPAYFGSYDDFDIIRDFTDKFENLFLVGRNGMHRYNNMDHSMLSAIVSVENIINNVKTKDNIWNINSEKKYHESS
ncbi:MAG: NAD(P)/FAD-dependent oxidoreductase [Methanobrevibacter sp.]|jgi:protoporphyrinogen oxidase|nr:NAD(P)/FAD-dependent oxidoreductase [Candidatus Methanovirga meridionalis]